MLRVYKNGKTFSFYREKSINHRPATLSFASYGLNISFSSNQQKKVLFSIYHHPILMFLLYETQQFNYDFIIEITR